VIGGGVTIIEAPKRPAAREDEVNLVRRCLECDDELSTWEFEFCTSIKGALGRWGRLTTKQRACLDRIIVKLKARDAW
jgi:hypothetical protein